MNLRSDKDVGTYLLKSRSDDNEKMSCYRKFNRGFNFYKENYIGEKTFYKENIPAFSVQRKSRSISVLQKNLVTIIQKHFRKLIM
jgi:hypothetical protein